MYLKNSNQNMFVMKLILYHYLLNTFQENHERKFSSASGYYEQSNGGKLSNSNSINQFLRQSYNQQEQLDLVREMAKEFETLKQSNEFVGRSPWLNILKRLDNRNYNNMNLKRLRTLWSKISVSAKTHSKDGGDVVDTEAWDLLQAFKKHLESKSKSKVPAIAVRGGESGIGDNQVDMKEAQVIVAPVFPYDNDRIAEVGEANSDDCWEADGSENEDDRFEEPNKAPHVVPVIKNEE